MNAQRCSYPSCDCDGPDGPACGLPGYAETMTQALPYDILTHEYPPTHDLAVAALQELTARLERVTRERDEARAELVQVSADYEAWRNAIDAALTRANERAESWSQIARAQARELTALRAAAQRVVEVHENGLDFSADAFWAALDGLTFALTDEPTEADRAE